MHNLCDLWSSNGIKGYQGSQVFPMHHKCETVWQVWLLAWLQIWGSDCQAWESAAKMNCFLEKSSDESLGINTRYKGLYVLPVKYHGTHFGGAGEVILRYTLYNCRYCSTPVHLSTCTCRYYGTPCTIVDTTVHLYILRYTCTHVDIMVHLYTCKY